MGPKWSLTGQGDHIIQVARKQFKYRFAVFFKKINSDQVSPVEKCQPQVPPTVYFIKRLKIIPCNKYVRTYFLSEVHVYLQNVQYLIWTICNHILLIVRGINELSLKAIKVEQSRWMPWIIKDWRAKWSRVTNWMLMQRWRSVILPALIKNKRMAQWSSWPRSTRHNYDFH